MGRLGRYWLIFAIVAVGLVLSWGQVGRKTQRVFEAEPIVYLVNERGCQPSIAPCAAVAGDRALVLGPAAQGLALRPVGMKRAELVSGEVLFMTADAGEVGRQTLQMEAYPWLLAPVPVAAQMVRVRIVGSREATVGEFPLR